MKSRQLIADYVLKYAVVDDDESDQSSKARGKFCFDAWLSNALCHGRGQSKHGKDGQALPIGSLH